MKGQFTKIEDDVKSAFSYKRINPHAQWNNLLYSFFIIIFLLIVFSFYLLIKIKNQQIFQSIQPSAELPSLINEKLLKEVNQSFSDKEVRQKEVQDGQDIYKDPSIN